MNKKLIVANEAQGIVKNRQESISILLAQRYQAAETLHESDGLENLKQALGEKLFATANRLAKTSHAARGVALTLCAYKFVLPTQNILLHKSEVKNGFSARSYDTYVTVPFLQSKSLSYNVETHWLSQTLSFATDYSRNTQLKTNPKTAGPDFIETVNSVQESEESTLFAQCIVDLILYHLIDERNRGKVVLLKPKDLAIAQVIQLLQKHFNYGYKKNSPRLPQLAIYAMYECIMNSVARYNGMRLGKLERLKTANRKSGTVGDIDVLRDSQPFEAVEVKFGIPINTLHVKEAIEKIKKESVERYLILSTKGVLEEQRFEINEILSKFKKDNGCEIIVNGVLETIKYYLRLVRSTTDFIWAYAKLVEVDSDLNYEHRVFWNSLCSEPLTT